MFKKLIKLVVYSFAVAIILPLSSVLGENEKKTNYSASPLGPATAHADTPPPSGGGGDDDCDDGGGDSC